ncbi:MAG TPA: MOSC N-terminal beta barrel domain-containing protein [Acidimicrobiales bacterium]
MDADTETDTDTVATVAGLFRYPVKSLQGMAVDDLEVGADGAAGDRDRALVDVATGKLMSAKRWSRLLQGAADDDGVALPDGRRFGYDDPDLDAVLSDWLGRPVALRRAGPGVEVVYEMTFDPPDDSAELVDIPAPTGTFLDLAAVHLVSRETLAACATARPDLDWDVRRFRPNVLIDAPGLEAFGEDDWCGRRLGVGGAVLSARQPTVRCAMPLRPQPGLDGQPALFRALNDIHANHLGIYLDVVTPGPVRTGDAVTLLPA